MYTSSTQSEQSPSCGPSSTEKDMVTSRDQPNTDSVERFQDLDVLTNNACPLINARKIDLGYELNGRRCVRVSLAAVDVEAVDSIFMHTLS